MKKFFRKRRKNDGGSVTSSAIEDTDIVNSADAAVETALEGDAEKISSPLVSKHKSSNKIAKAADDNVAEANEEATVASSDESGTIHTPLASISVKDSAKGSRRTEKTKESVVSKAKNAYNCFSGSIYTVATGMDNLLTTCSNTCCVPVEDESQFNSRSMSMAD